MEDKKEEKPNLNFVRDMETTRRIRAISEAGSLMKEESERNA